MMIATTRFVMTAVHATRNRVLFLIAVAFLFTHAADSQGWLKATRLDVGLSSVYDNNILRYSDKYIDRFNKRQDEGRFHINTLDDLILVTSMRGSASVALIGSLNTTASIDFRKRTYTHNAIKDWQYFGLTLRQDISKRIAAQIGYNYTPSFYIRHYRDDDWAKEFGYIPVTFQPYGYKKDDVNSWIQYSLSTGTRVRALFAYTRYFYNEHFTEYDCANSSYGIELYQTILKTIRVSAGFGYVESRGDGTATMNPSYDEDSFDLGVDLQLPKVFGRANSIGVSGEYARRVFTTHHYLELDINHAGRRDHDYRFSATYGFELMKSLSLGLSYAWHRRDAETSAQANAEYLAEEKNYKQYQISFDVRYSLTFSPSDISESERTK